MKRSTQLLIAGCALATIIVAGLISFGVWRYWTSRHSPPPPQYVLLRDRSDSNSGGCDAFAAMAKAIIESPGLKKGTNIVVMVTGDDSTSSEPQLIDTLEVPISRRVADGRSQVMQQRQELLDKIKTHCQNAGQTTQSPIYMGIRRSVEYLRANGCGERSTCSVYVQTDLEETSERIIKQMINTTTPQSGEILFRTQQLPARIENSGISIKVCGIAETVGTVPVGEGKQRSFSPKRDSQRTDRLDSVWKSLVTDSQNVIFSPQCPKG